MAKIKINMIKKHIYARNHLAPLAENFNQIRISIIVRNEIDIIAKYIMHA